MNAKKLIAAVAVLAAASSVLADNSLPYVEFSKSESTRDRADVVAEIIPGAAGLSTANNDYPRFSTAGSTLTRAEVLAELEKDFIEGRNTALANPEFIDSTKFASTGTHDQARAEAVYSAHRKFMGNQKSGS